MGEEQDAIDQEKTTDLRKRLGKKAKRWNGEKLEPVSQVSSLVTMLDPHSNSSSLYS